MTFAISLILIWGLGATILFFDIRNESNRWASATAFIIGLRYLADFIEEVIIPSMKVNATSTSLLPFVSSLLTKVALLVYPYVFLMFALSCTNILKLGIKKVTMFISLLPVIALFAFLPLGDFIHPTTKLSYRYVSILSSSGILLSDFILLYSYFRAPSINTKKNLQLICLWVIPPTLFGQYINFLLPAIGIKDSWRLNILVIVLLVVLYGYFVIKHGILGVKLSIERKCLNSAMKSATSGTQILSHAIKNEVLIISLCSRNINSAAKLFDKSEFDKHIGQNVQNILTSADHLLKLVGHIREYMHDIHLKQSPNNLVDIIEDSLNLITAYLNEKDITINRLYSHNQHELTLMCDRIHIQETLNNIFKNAIEAMNSGGTISIQVTQNRKYVIVEIMDNGPGISKEDLPFVIDPFFSTKKYNLNFGLGLSYCYNIMQMHGGSLEIDSAVNKGTTVLLKFSAKKSIKIRRRGLPK